MHPSDPTSSVSCCPGLSAVRRGLTFLVMGVALATVTLAATAGRAAEDGDRVDFATDVWPIIETSCLECHDNATSFSNLRLDSPDAILEGGDLGKVVVPGSPDESPLVLRVALPQDDLDFMPIEGDPLTEEQIATLRLWIEQGADFGDWTGVQ